MSGEGPVVDAGCIAYFIGDPRAGSRHRRGVLETVPPSAPAGLAAPPPQTQTPGRDGAGLAPAGGTSAAANAAASPAVSEGQAVAQASCGSRYVCIENIPKFITPAELLGHVAGFRDDVAGLRVLGCTENKAQYYLMMDVGDAATAARLRELHHGRPFSALGGETMFVSFVSPASAEPLLLCDSSEGVEQCPVCLEPLLDAEGAMAVRTPPQHPSPVPQEAEGFPLSASFSSNIGHDVLWTTMCGHTAHFRCILKHDHGTGCPVCRFNPAELGVECAEPGCGETDTLWMCLVCGNLGCGRYLGVHAEAHYKASGHTYALEVSSGSVWDYSADDFVHRLVASRSDGQLVNVQKKAEGGPGGEAGQGGVDAAELAEMSLESKLHSVSDTYAHLLDTQLATQQLYYTDLLARELREHEALVRRLQSVKPPAGPAVQSAEVEEVVAAAAACKKQAAKLVKKNAEVKKRAAALTDELQTEQAMNKQIEAGTAKYRQKLTEMQAKESKLQAKEKERTELEARIASLMQQLEM